MILRNVECTFHHMGIPTTIPHPSERYSEAFGMYTRDAACDGLRVQWHRFTEKCPLHPLLQNVPHLAFKVKQLEEAIHGQEVLLGPYEPIAGFRVAAIANGEIPLEFIQTSLTDEEIWGRAATESVLYREGALDAQIMSHITKVSYL